MTECPICNAEIPAGKDNCPRCLPLTGNGESNSAGAIPAVEPGTPGERRLLTILFCDLVDSSRLASRLDPEDLRDVLTAYQRDSTEIIEAAGGMIARYEGDGILAYFGYPAASEDDAERAVNAGLELARHIGTSSSQEPALRVRVGIATGVVVVGDLFRSGVADSPPIVGETPNLAARLQGSAEPNTVVIASSTQLLTRGLFEYQRLVLSDVKGFEAPVLAFRVIGTSEIASRFAALRSNLPLVGREKELRHLVALWERAKDGEGVVALLRGEPGIGKSRLALELLHQVRRQFPTIRRLYCSPHHKDSILYPLLAQLQRTASIEPADPPETKLEKLKALLVGAGDAADALVATLADLMGLPPRNRFNRPLPEARERRELLFELLVGEFKRLARLRPLLVLIEDIHWMDPTSMEVLKIIVGSIRDLPAMIVATTRPDGGPAWGEDASVAAFDLGPIDQASAAALVKHITKIADLEDPVLRGIVARADGIPLFVEELAKAALESGAIESPPRPAAKPGSQQISSIPVSLHASLLSRLDRLGRAAHVLKTAAAFGREFLLPHLTVVMEGWTTSDVEDALHQLIEVDLVVPVGPPPWTTFSFRHSLIQDVAYGTLLRAERRRLHGRIAEALEQVSPQSIAVEPEIIAAHFTKADLFAPAVRYWRDAGVRAADRSAFSEAIQHFSEGVQVSRLLPESPERARQELDLLMALGPALMVTKGYAAEESLDVFAQADQLVTQVGTVSERLDVLLGLFNVHYGRSELSSSLEVARNHLRLSTSHGQAEARAHCLLGQTYSAMGDFIEAKKHFRSAIDIFARQPEARGSWGVMASQHVVTLALSAGVHFALGEFETARTAIMGAVEQARRIDHPLSIALATVTEVLTPSLGDLQTASARAADAVQYCARHGFKNFEAWARFAQSAIAVRRGELDDGIRGMWAAVEAAEELQSRLFRPVQLATLASAYVKVGDTGRALDLIEQSLAIVAATEERQALPGILRLKGEVLFALEREAEGKAALLAASDAARLQHAIAEAHRIKETIARLVPSAQVEPQPMSKQMQTRGWRAALRALLGY